MELRWRQLRITQISLFNMLVVFTIIGTCLAIYLKASAEKKTGDLIVSQLKDTVQFKYDWLTPVWMIKLLGRGDETANFHQPIEAYLDLSPLENLDEQTLEKIAAKNQSTP